MDQINYGGQKKSYGFNLSIKKNFLKYDANEFNLNLNYKHYGKHFE